MTESTETSFSAKLNGPPLLRIGVVVAAFLVLVTSAALTIAASPDPSGSASPAPAATAPATGGDGWGGPGMGRRGFDGARGFGGPGLGLGRRGFGEITISAISGSNVSLKTPDGWSRTIAIASSTKITKGGQAIAIGDLEVGDQVTFRQARNSDGTFTIDALEVVLPRVAGEVTATTSSTITVKAFDGTSVTIHVTADTAYQVSGVTNAKLSDVAVGMKVVAEGTKASDGSLSATSVWAASVQQGWGPGRGHDWGHQDNQASPAPSASPTGSSDGA